MFRVDTTNEIKYDRETMLAVSEMKRNDYYYRSGGKLLGLEFYKGKCWAIWDKASVQSYYDNWVNFNTGM